MDKYEVYKLLHLSFMKFILLLQFLISTFICNGQYHLIKGKVLDMTGKPISHANIKSVKTNEITMSSKDGSFSLTTPYIYDTLICSHVSYQEQNEILSGNDTVNFFLLPDASSYFISIDTISNQEDSALIKRWKAKREDVSEDVDVIEEPPFNISIPAKFRGGENSFKIQFKIIFEKLGFKKFSGKVKLRLVINKKGIIDKIDILKGVNRTIDKTVITTIKKMRSWEPAIQNGWNVNYHTTVEVEY